MAKGINPEEFANDELSRFAWNAFDGAKVKFHSSRAEAEASMAACGDGAVAIVKVNWKDEGAHYFIAEQANGKTVFIDPQDGTINAERHFEKARQPFFMARVDNLEPSALMKDAIEARI